MLYCFKRVLDCSALICNERFCWLNDDTAGELKGRRDLYDV